MLKIYTARNVASPSVVSEILVVSTLSIKLRMTFRINALSLTIIRRAVWTVLDITVGARDSETYRCSMHFVDAVSNA